MVSFKATSALALLASLAASAPTTRRYVYPPTSTSLNFKLVANVTDYAVLVQNTTVDSGRIFYVNGTAEEVRYNSADLLSDGGTPLFPWGVWINEPNAAGEQTVSVNAGIGQTGLGLTQFPDPISELRGLWYACNNTLEYGPAIQLLSKETGAPTPAGCADITLLPQCSVGSGMAQEFPNESECYEDVAGIDWTYYNTD
ncbi:hypothetical protein B7494_g5214 [Chlorociboria aeruginascens]|nr:hypothetical protein B7494_g5214 [Chlorociboria aeruginascens]